MEAATVTIAVLPFENDSRDISQDYFARGFVEAMGGTIKAESPAQKRKGTRMILRFPVEAVPAETEVAS